MEGDPVDLVGGDRGRGECAAGGWGMGEDEGEDLGEDVGEDGSGDDGRAREMDDLGSPFGRSP